MKVIINTEINKKERKAMNDFLLNGSNINICI